jgi:antitoxin (DNA-binding transcriptional repressor) of toxin-antitoxin stability system
VAITVNFRQSKKRFLTLVEQAHAGKKIIELKNGKPYAQICSLELAVHELAPVSAMQEQDTSSIFGIVKARKPATLEQTEEAIDRGWGRRSAMLKSDTRAS